jgi:uncharacterized protein (AIM24 family)
MTDTQQRLQCKWCRAQSPATARSCDTCGAPLDTRELVTDSGWRQTPRLRDLTELHWSSSTCQVDTGVVPVVEAMLAAGDAVFFEHHTMLWKDETTAMSVMNTPGGAKRLLSGMPFVLSVAHGPGRVAFSRDAPGELVILPVEAPGAIDVREHALILASATLTYSFEKLPGFRAMFASGTGMYLDRYVAAGTAPALSDGGTGGGTGQPSLLVLHGYGNVFQRTLVEGETILIEPGGFLYKDAAVGLELITIDLKHGQTDGPTPAAGPDAPAGPPEDAGGRIGRGLRGLKAAKSMINAGALASAAQNLRAGQGIQGLAAGLAGGGGTTVFRVRGPGRVGVQSMFKPVESE